MAAAFERRAARADALARESTTPAPLEFAAGLYRAQGAVAAAIEKAALVGALEQDLPGFAAALAGVIRFAARRGPPGLSAEARAREGQGGDPLVAWWRGERSGRADYLGRALLRPYAEVLAARGVRPEPPQVARDGGCPFCGGPALIGLRRAAAGDAGAQRLLGCAVCGGEWPVNRIRCPACAEEGPDKLPQFQSERYPAVRLESCDACRGYLKSIDLTVDARAIPEVDDLSSLSMDLWAAEQGYTRLEPSLAGI
ncbi:MAG TPA: formate dehydrogenase accessory protein FdhE [Kofleriaceae bacterium]|nr:formate dehydrogenase accessory protein FdhE [Kofleriaceae bacterium]